MSKRTLSISSLSSQSETDLPQNDMDAIDSRPRQFTKSARRSYSSALPSPSDQSHSPKYGGSMILRDAQQTVSVHQPKIQCLLPPHLPMVFASIASFEAHIYSHHTNRCASCDANLPTAHLLDLHTTEIHDPLAAVRRDRGERIYACLVAGCEKLCINRWKRRRHVVDKHHWCKDYDWAVVERGTDGRESTLRDVGATKQKKIPAMQGMKGHNAEGIYDTAAAACQLESNPRNQVLFMDVERRSQPPIIAETENSVADIEASLEKLSDYLEIEEQKEQTYIGAVQTCADASIMKDLTNSMSVLRFVPASVRAKRPQVGTTPQRTLI